METTTNTTKTMKTFEIGQKYFCRSACDYNCIWIYEVIRRTASSITIRDERGEVSTKRFDKYGEMFGAEQVHPLGRYSMAPILSADNAC